MITQVSFAYKMSWQDIMDMPWAWFEEFYRDLDPLRAEEELSLFTATAPFYMETSDSRKAIRAMQSRYEALHPVDEGLAQEGAKAREEALDTQLQLLAQDPIMGQFVHVVRH